MRKSRENLEIAIAHPSIYEKQPLSTFNGPRYWKTINQCRNHVFPYYFNNLEREGTNADKVSIHESTQAVTHMKDNIACKTSYISEHVIFKNISYILFNSQYKALYNYSKFISSTSPEQTQYLDVEHEDMLYQVKFTVKTKKEYNNTYPKLCVLNKSKLPVCCIQVKTLDSSQEDDTMQCFDNKERMDTLILNEQFSKVLNNTFPCSSDKSLQD